MTGLTSATLAPVAADGNFFPMAVFYPMEAMTLMLRCYASIRWNVSLEGRSGPRPDRGQGIRHEDDDIYR